MRLAGKQTQHCCSVFSVARFLQHFAVKNDNRIRPQHRQIARCHRHPGLRFFARQADNIVLGALLRLALFLNTGNQTLESETKLSQQFLPTRGT